MDDLIKLVSQKTGISEDKARVAVETVIGFLKQKLPAPIAGQIDSALGGAGLTDDLKEGLGGLLEKK